MKRMTAERFHELVREEALKRVLELARRVTQKRDKATIGALRLALENLDAISR